MKIVSEHRCKITQSRCYGGKRLGRRDEWMNEKCAAFEKSNDSHQDEAEMPKIRRCSISKLETR